MAGAKRKHTCSLEPSRRHGRNWSRLYCPDALIHHTQVATTTLTTNKLQQKLHPSTCHSTK